ncbi:MULTISPECIES: ATP-grasp domain-containing protein [Streptomyces]|uniref:ATP-grasp domain-containing protein n=1 Tax=Streptomyces sudanensis TaxID=436397 RepID=A0ABY4TH79_9ACTN|nr:MULTISPECIES: ATP-grasp domain-containing protein [Streptomyces]URN18231.1 ATP-grasp domain-containing protein [Streptomyces sudanensis]
MAVIGGTINILLRAAALDVSVVLFHKEGAYDPESVKYCTELVHVDFVDDPEALVELVRAHHERRPFDRVMSLTENGLVPAARLNEILGLGGNSLRTAELLKDKVSMRRRLDEEGISPVAYRAVRSRQELDAFRQLIGGPVFVKPVNGSASVAVQRVDTSADAASAWARLTAAGYDEAIAEEFLEGPEFSVDAYSWQGRHTVIAVTRKLLAPNSLEIGHSMPAQLEEDTRSEMTRMVRAMLDAVGLVEGPTHTEVRLTPKGPRIIESQNRIGGSRLYEMMSLAFGIDIIRLAVAVPLGLEPAPEKTPDTLAGAAVRYFTPPPGVVTAITGTEHLPDDGTLRLALGVAVGDTVAEQRTSIDRDTLGCYVVCSGADEADAVARCERALDTVTITTRAVAR